MENKILFYQEGTTRINIPLENIVFVESDGNYCDFYLTSSLKALTVRITLTDVKKGIDDLGTFAEHHLFKVSRKHIINTKFITRLTPHGVPMVRMSIHDKEFKVGKALSKELIAELNKEERDQILKTYGKSFCLDIPLEELNDEHPEMDGHEYVDLGLPSGNLWSAKNLDGIHTDSIGREYSRYEKTVKESFELIEYNGVDTLSTSYTDSFEVTDDIVKNLWRSKWQMPTQEDFLELFSKCTTVWCRTLKKRYGVLFTGPNGNSMFIPADSYDKIRGYYWTVEMTKFACPTTSIIIEEDRDAGDARVSYGSHAIVESAYIRPVIHIIND